MGLPSNVDMQAVEIEKLNAGKCSLVNVISRQDRTSGLDRERFNWANNYRGSDLGYVFVASKELKALSVRSGHEKVDLFLFVAVEMRRWACRGEDARRNCVVVSFGSVTSPFHGESTARSGRFYQSSFLLDAAFSKALVLQHMSRNGQSEMFYFSEYQAAFGDAVALSGKTRAKFRYCLSEKCSSRKGKAKNLLFLPPRCRFLFFQYATKPLRR